MNIDNYSYLWNEKKEDFVLVKTDFGYTVIDKRERSMLLIEESDLEQKIVRKMLENGNKVYDDIMQAFNDV